MSDLVVISFNDEHMADEVLLTLGRLQADHLIDLEDAAVVVRKQDGKMKIKQTQNLTLAGAVGGGFWGAFFGILFGGPLGFLVVGGTTAAVGALMGKLRDIGVDDDFIKEVGDSLEPGSSAIFTLVISSTTDRVLESLQQYQGKVVRTSLSRDSEDALVQALA